MSETAEERRERQRVSDAQRIAEMNAQGSGIARIEAPKSVELQPHPDRTLKVVKTELKEAGKRYKDSISSHRAVMQQCKDLLKPSLDNKRYWYNLKLKLAEEKKAMGGLVTKKQVKAVKKEAKPLEGASVSDLEKRWES
jgi:hypothetical protein